MSAIVVNLNSGSLIFALAPTLAVIVNYYLSKRQRMRIKEEATVAVEKAIVIVDESKNRVEEIYKIVNSQRDDMKKEIDKRDRKIVVLEAKLELLTSPTTGPPTSPTTVAS